MSFPDLVRALEKELLASFHEDRRAIDVFRELERKGFDPGAVKRLFDALVLLRYIVRVNVSQPAVYAISTTGLKVYRALYAKET